MPTWRCTMQSARVARPCGGWVPEAQDAAPSALHACSRDRVIDSCGFGCLDVQGAGFLSLRDPAGIGRATRERRGLVAASGGSLTYGIFNRTTWVARPCSGWVPEAQDGAPSALHACSRDRVIDSCGFSCLDAQGAGFFSLRDPADSGRATLW